MEDFLKKQISENYEQILDRVASAALKSGRKPDQICVVVVTKAHSIETVKAVVDSGIENIGENYVEEAILKMNSINVKNIKWHMIGHIQSRKARLVSQYFQFVHSVDRIKVARKLNQALETIQTKLPILLECNVSGETTKHGFPAWDDEQWFGLEAEIEEIVELPNIRVQGLMTIPPWNPNPEESRTYFKRLVRLQNYLGREFPHATWDDLSMGMSNDFEIAIQEGATYVRIGTAIVGPRD